MKNSIVFGVGVALISLVRISSAADDSVLGKWQTEPGDTGGRVHVLREPCGDKLCGTIVSAVTAEGAVNDTYEHLGKQMIKDMKKKGPASYAKGKIWAPDKNKTYNSSMKLADSGNLVVKGCVAFICRTQVWTRVN